jgi:hypothetical protein
MTYAQPEPEDDDEERLAIALAPRMAAYVSALFAITMVPKDRELLGSLARRAPQTLTAEHRLWITRLAWKYRSDMRRSLRPKLNPDDPIVREMEMAGV